VATKSTIPILFFEPPASGCCLMSDILAIHLKQIERA
jgi:hypothetical protein